MSVLKSDFTSMTGFAATPSTKIQWYYTKTQNISALNSTDFSQLLPTMSNALYSVTGTPSYQHIYSTDSLIHSLQSIKISPATSSYSSGILRSTLPQTAKSNAVLYSNTVNASSNASTTGGKGSSIHNPATEDAICITFLLFISGVSLILLVCHIVQITVSYCQ